MPWLDKFREHPASVGETYGEHMRSAFSFGTAMLGASLACLVHGVLPWLYKTKGSETVRLLHERMVVHRSRQLNCAREDAHEPDAQVPGQS